MTGGAELRKQRRAWFRTEKAPRFSSARTSAERNLPGRRGGRRCALLSDAKACTRPWGLGGRLFDHRCSCLPANDICSARRDRALAQVQRLRCGLHAGGCAGGPAGAAAVALAAAPLAKRRPAGCHRPCCCHLRWRRWAHAPIAVGVQSAGCTTVKQVKAEFAACTRLLTRFEMPVRRSSKIHVGKDVSV